MIDKLFGVFLLSLGLFFVWGGNKLEVPFSYDPLGPKFFPMAVGVMLAVLAIIAIIKSKNVSFPGSNTVMKTILIVVLLFAYQLTFNFLGFLLSTAILAFSISRIFKGTTMQALGAGVGVSGTVYLMFNTILDVPLPVGTIFNSLLGA